MARKSRSFVVIGLGRFGGTVAAELARFGNHVLGIDSDERRVSPFAPTLSATAILDASDEQALREAGVDRYDVALVSIGQDIQASILTTMNLRMLGLGTIWVKAATRTHHRILSKLGADRVIEPEQEMGRHAAQMLNNPAVHDYMALGNGFSVVSIVVPATLEGAPLAGLRLGEDFELRPLGLMRGTEYLSCGERLILQRDDRLLVLGKRADLRRFGDTL